MCVVFLSVYLLLAWHNAVLHGVIRSRACIVSGNESETHFIYTKLTKSEMAVSLWGRHVSTLSELFLWRSCPHGENGDILSSFIDEKLNFASQSTSGSMTDEAWILCTSVFNHLLRWVLIQPISQFNCSRLHIFCFCFWQNKYKTVICSWIINATC